VRSAFLFCLGGLTAALSAAEPRPLARAHAHNDYEHPRPLLDALERGFCSVEADVYFIDGQLLVAHDRKDVRPDRTLSKLYLDPLRERVRRNGGRVYAGGPAVILLIDVKSEASSTYAAVHAELERYREMMTTYRAGQEVTGAVTAIISGNRAPKDVMAQPVRYAALDGRKDDLEREPAVTLVPLVSENWQSVFTWRWQGEMPSTERAKLQQWVARAHQQRRKVRFWNTPDRVEVWSLLLEAGVDLIGTDDLAALQQFLQSQAK
jgi:glycerophosphoryl diester phosphodiesterase